jgi:hypothetical protein
MSQIITILPQKLKIFMNPREMTSRLGSARESAELIQFWVSFVQSGMSGTSTSNIELEFYETLYKTIFQRFGFKQYSHK